MQTVDKRREAIEENRNARIPPIDMPEQSRRSIYFIPFMPAISARDDKLKRIIDGAMKAKVTTYADVLAYGTKVDWASLVEAAREYIKA